MSDLELGWAAGIVDGEGHIRIGQDSRGRWMLQLSVGNTDKMMVEILKGLFGGAVNGPYLPKKGRACYQWSVSTKRAGEVLEKLLPVLVTKRAQASVAIQFQRTMAPTGKGRTRKTPSHVIEQREELARRIKELRHG